MRGGGRGGGRGGEYQSCFLAAASAPSLTVCARSQVEEVEVSAAVAAGAVMAAGAGAVAVRALPQSPLFGESATRLRGSDARLCRICSARQAVEAGDLLAVAVEGAAGAAGAVVAPREALRWAASRLLSCTVASPVSARLSGLESGCETALPSPIAGRCGEAPSRGDLHRPRQGGRARDEEHGARGERVRREAHRFRGAKTSVPTRGTARAKRSEGSQ